MNFKYSAYTIPTEGVEYKKFTLHKSNTSLIGMEIPSQNGRFYPLPFKKEQLKAKKYFDLISAFFLKVLPSSIGSPRYLNSLRSCI